MADDSAYIAWVNTVHQLGGVATAWPFSTGPYGSNYAQAAARFPAATFAQLAAAGTLPMSDGVQFNVPGTWVYVLASSMSGGSSAVDDSITTSVNTATQAEQEAACAVNGNCPTDFEKLIKEILIGAAVVVGGLVAIKALNVVKDWE